jgi:hypothetical protein
VIVKLKILHKKKEKAKKQTTTTNEMYGWIGKSCFMSSPVIVAYGCGFLDASVSSQGWYSG